MTVKLLAGSDVLLEQEYYSVGQSFIASPIIAGGAIYLRSRTHLFKIGN